MDPLDGLSQAWRFSVRKALRRWVRVTVKPEDAATALSGSSKPVCYVIERESATDLAVLGNLCRQLHLPAPERRLFAAGRRAGLGYFELSRRPRPFSRRAIARAPRHLEAMVKVAAADPQFDLDLVPVAIFWGRAPGKEVSLWRLLLAENWVLVGGFRKLLNVIFNGRNTVVHFGEPIGLRDALEGGIDPARAVRRIQRSLRAALKAQRASTIGPDLSHRRTLVAHLLNTQSVRQAVRREMQARSRPGRPFRRRAALLLARRHALEIAANYSQAFITFMSLVLGRLWNWLYDGVEFEHVDRLAAIGDHAEIIYVPCHRSHMDYLLLSYVLYHKGFAVPHVAAGANLNMPVIGRFLRKGGAFFLRRSFKGDALYAAVFTRYLGFMMARGHPLEYFIEGGRSRTGRLLAPRTGMLSMTVRTHLRHPKRAVVFVPVYFGYERIPEGRTYLGELSGRPKEKESLAGVLRAVASVLRSKFGKVYVNLGEPIALGDVLQRHHAAWHATAGEAGADDPPAGWLHDAIGDLAHSILVGINAAAAVTPVNLVATAMLATPRQALAESALQSQIELYKDILRAVPYSPLVTVSGEGGAAMVYHAERMGLIERQRHPLGDIMRMTGEQAVLATYYRNNILHLLAMPSLLACGFIGNATMRTADLKRLVWRVYPYIAAELNLRWQEDEIGEVVDSLLDAFLHTRLLNVDDDRQEWRRPAPTSFEAIKLSLLAQGTLPTLERYYLVVALLLQAGPGLIGQEALEQRCHLVAQRMAVLYGLDSPEFFDKSLFRRFIDLLLVRQVIERRPDGTLSFGAPLHGVAADAQWVLSEQIRHSILQVTLG